MNQALLLQIPHPALYIEKKDAAWYVKEWNHHFEVLVEDIPSKDALLTDWVKEADITWLADMTSGMSTIVEWEGHWLLAERMALEDQMLLIIRDISVQVKMEDAYKELEARLRRTQMLGKIGDWENNLAKGTEFWSDELYRLMGFKEQTIKPHVENFMRFVVEEDVARLGQVHADAFDGKPYEVEFRIKDINHEEKWMLTRAKVVFDEKGDPARVQGFMQDITVQKQMEEQVRDALKELERADQAKSHFLATISHEIRTPLNAIVGYSEQIKKHQPNDLILDDTDQIHQHAFDLLQIVDDILDMSKIEQGKLTAHMQPFDLHIMLRNIIRTFSYKTEEKNIRFEQYMDRALPNTIMTDGVKLQQVLVNILGNAVKFTERGKVRFVASVDKEEGAGNVLKFEMRDTGIGISEDQIERIFHSYEQADDDISKRFGGSGLGLAISKHYVDLLGGNLEVTSQLGEGSTFTLTIPLTTVQDLYMSQTQSKPTTGFEGISLDVLVVEDNMINQAYIRGLLEKAYGFNVSVCTMAGMALDEVKSGNWDCIFIDDVLPDMKGDQLAREIRSLGDHGKSPLVGLASSAYDSCWSGEGQNLVEEVLLKPITERKLFDVLSGVIDKAAYERVEEVRFEPQFYRFVDEKLIQDRIHHVGQQSVVNVVNYAIDEYKMRTASIETALQKGNLDQIRIDFLALKGNVEYFGSEEIEEGVKLIESAFHSGDTSGLDVIVQDFLEEFKIFYKDLLNLQRSLQ